MSAGTIRFKKWNIRDRSIPESAREMARELGVTPVTAALLTQRGLEDTDAARRYLHFDGALLHNAFLFEDMEKACERILRAVREQEKITVYGDYDVDGVTSVCSLLLYLRELGADAAYYIPDRMEEGYGVHEEAVRRLAAQGTRLLITVDTGVTAVSELALAQELGMEVIVTDHHTCQEQLPQVYALLNPQAPGCRYPFRELAGVGVVFKLLCALEKTRGNPDYLTDICRRVIDLTALGTIADVMPLVDENRLIVSIGLRSIARERRPGMAALLEAAGAKGTVSSSVIGFTVAPRLNAAGRMGSADLAAELFLSRDPQRVRKIAAELCELNRRRQERENQLLAQAQEKIDVECDPERDGILVLAGEGWHHGVIGIAASRITEKYHLPSILISLDGDTGKGSGRSVRGLHLAEALSACSQYLQRYGGHELAAGLTLSREQLEPFRQAIGAYARAHLPPEARVAELDADLLVTPDALTLRQARELSLLEPYGMGNALPVLVWENAEVLELHSIGGGRHTRLTLGGQGCEPAAAVFFGRSAEELDLSPGERVDAAFQLEINTFGGQESVQLLVRDIRPAGLDALAIADASRRCAAFLRGEDVPLEPDWLPTRAHCSALYVCLRTLHRQGRHIAGLHTLRRMCGVGYPMSALILRVFEECGLARVDGWEDRFVRFSLCPAEKKVSLEQSACYRRLCAAHDKLI